MTDSNNGNSLIFGENEVLKTLKALNEAIRACHLTKIMKPDCVLNKVKSEIGEEKGWINIGDARLEIPHESRSLRLRINIQEKVNEDNSK